MGEDTMSLTPNLEKRITEIIINNVNIGGGWPIELEGGIVISKNTLPGTAVIQVVSVESVNYSVCQRLKEGKEDES